MKIRAQEPEFDFRLADSAEPQGDVLSALADLLIDLNDPDAEEQEPRIHSPRAQQSMKKPRTKRARGRMPPSHGQ